MCAKKEEEERRRSDKHFFLHGRETTLRKKGKNALPSQPHYQDAGATTTYYLQVGSGWEREIGGREKESFVEIDGL